MIKKAILTCGLLASQLSAADHRFIVDIMPGSFLVSSDVDGFTNHRGGDYEEIDGTTSFLQILQ